MRRWLQIPLALAALLLVLEGLLRLLPVSSATLIADHAGLGIPTYPPGHAWTTSTGWDLRNAHRHRANVQGFLAAQDFQRNPDAVALIGDSFVEASMLAPEDRLAPQLAARLSRPVYAIGSPGSALLDYGVRLQWAAREFGIRDAVLLLERGDVRQSRCGSGNNMSLCMDPRSGALVRVELPAPGLAKRILRNSALAQYLMGQLKLEPAALLANVQRQLHGAEGTPAPTHAPSGRGDELSDADRRLTDQVAAHFFAQLADFKGRLVLVVDADRIGMNGGGSGTDAAREYFLELARRRGLIVVDLRPTFRQHKDASDRALEVGPYDAHLNRLGLGLTARAIEGALNRP